MAWRAGRECGSGNIFSHSRFTPSRCERSRIQTVILMMLAGLPPAASTMRLTWANISALCSSMVAPYFPVAGSVPWMLPE